MSVDVVTGIVIDRPRMDVSAYAGNPTNAPEWSGSTRMTLRNRGNPSGVSTLVAPFMAAAMRRANKKDLQALNSRLESHG